MCYSNPTIVNMYTYYRKLVYKIIVNGGGYKITYFIASYRVYSLSIYIYIYFFSILPGVVTFYWEYTHYQGSGESKGG